MSTTCTQQVRYTKRPRVGDTIDSGRFGPSEVLTVRDHGMSLVIATKAHGTETVQRAKRGTWVVVLPEPSS